MTNIHNPGDFPTPQEEHQEPRPERVVEIGEWFNPFEKYDSLPRATDYENEHSKEVPFNVNGVGRFEASTYYRKDQLELGTKKEPVIVMLPDKDRVLSPEDLKKLELEAIKISIRPLEKNIVRISIQMIGKKYLTSLK